MKHVTYADKPFLMDDETADTLLSYAATVASHAMADTVTLQAIGPDGNEIEVTLLLDSATALVSETAAAGMVAPSNDRAVATMREKIRVLTYPPAALPAEAEPGSPGWSI